MHTAPDDAVQYICEDEDADVSATESVQTARTYTRPEEEAAISQLEIWLQAWVRKKDSPKDELELLPHSWQEPMALPTTWGERTCSPRLGPEDFFSLKEHQPCLGRTSQDLDAIAQEAVVSKLADSTKQSYGTLKLQYSLN